MKMMRGATLICDRESSRTKPTYSANILTNKFRFCLKQRVVIKSYQNSLMSKRKHCQNESIVETIARFITVSVPDTFKYADTAFRLSRSGNLFLRKRDSKLDRRACVECFQNDRIATSAWYPDERGKSNQLCAKHAKLKECHTVQCPCRDCPPGDKKQSNYPDERGKSNQLCSEHAKLKGCHTVRCPCRDCPPGDKKGSSYPDERGKSNQLCSDHAKLKGCHTVRCPCRDCPPGDKKESNYPDERGKLQQLCSEHAKLKGCHTVRCPCRDCPPGDKKESNYPDERGKSNQLCSDHAKLKGCHTVQCPCRDCPPGDKKESAYPDERGKSKQLCSEHAFNAGTIAKSYPGCSMEACAVWDKLEKEIGTKLQHKHFCIGEAVPSGSEYKIPGTNYSVDAYDPKTGVMYEYHGNAYHGYPPDHPKHYGSSSHTKQNNVDMYNNTMNRMQTIVEKTGDRMYYIWGHDQKSALKPLNSVMSRLTRVIPID